MQSVVGLHQLIEANCVSYRHT
uniref:Uncharacterized protein n=1 Tax=Triticum urartu TaxID=4572 RepID=A0A8R7Q7C8_TRIUA